MHVDRPKGLAAWAYALKPASWPKTLVPCLLGQAAGVAGQGRLSLAGLLLGLAFTALDTVFIVLLNDWGDRDVDALKRRMYPDAGSPKTIPDGILPAHRVLRAGLFAGAGALGLAVWGERSLDLPGLVVLAIVALGLFVAYTFPPLRLNYRGGGELLEAAGVGAALPLLNGWFQAGSACGPPLLVVLVGYVPCAVASAVASGLSDERSDRAGGKRTVTTWLGNPAARRIASASLGIGAMLWASGAAAAALLGAPASWVLGALAASLVVLAHLPSVARLARPAVTSAFAAHGPYKRALHVAAWRAGALLSMFLAWSALP